MLSKKRYYAVVVNKTVNIPVYLKGKVMSKNILSRVSIVTAVAVSLFSCSGQLSVDDEILATTQSSRGLTGYTEVWRDDFDGTSLDPNNWTIGLVDSATGDRVPGNGDAYYIGDQYASYITEDTTHVANGSLILESKEAYHPGVGANGSDLYYSSGMVMSMHKQYANKGYWEMRAKFPTGNKVWPAFWLVAEDLVWGPEWDMWEYFGYRSDCGYDAMGAHLASGTYQWSNKPNDDYGITWDTHWFHSFDATYDNTIWHTYGFEWTDTHANWYLDGQLIHTLTASESLGDEGSWPNEDMYMIINNGVKLYSDIQLDDSQVYPNYFEIDYVSYAAPDGTPVDPPEDPVDPPASEGITNADFETGVITPWTGTGEFGVKNNYPHTGVWAGYCGGASSSVEQVVAVTPSTTYVLGGWLRLDTNKEAADFGVNNFSGNDVHVTTTSKSWVYQEIEFTTGANDTTVNIYLKHASGGKKAYFDDLTLSIK